MDKLTPEIITIIVAYLRDADTKDLYLPASAATRLRPSFASHAAISRRWQHAVEIHTLASVKLTSMDLADFSLTYGSARRRSLLQRLDFDVVLPAYRDEQITKLETEAEHAANVDVFEREVHTLFKQLHHWEASTEAANEHPVSSRNFTLSIIAHSPMDPEHRPDNLPPGLGRNRTEGHYLTLRQFDLPSLKRISAFELPLSPCRPLHPSAICKVLASLPNVEKLDLDIVPPRRKREAMRREHRVSFGRGLEALELNALAELAIHWEASDPLNHSAHTGNLHDLDRSDVDSLNTALRKLSQSSPLTSLELLNAGVSPELFMDLEDPEDPVLRVWPTLRHVKIEARLLAPDGKWYYTGNRPPETNENGQGLRSLPADGGGSSRGLHSVSKEANTSVGSDRPDEQQEAYENGNFPRSPWRTRPDPEVFNPFVESLADAVQRMPALEHLSFRIGTSLPGARDVNIEAFGTGEKSWKVVVGHETEWDIPPYLLDSAV